MENRMMSISFNSICIIATVVMAILKLAGVLACSWWIVFLPIIVSVALTILIVIVYTIVVLIVRRRVEK